MTRPLVYNVVRRPGGWVVEFDGQSLCCYRHFEEAVARARQLGREDWRESGRPSEIVVESVTGQLRQEAAFGFDQPTL